MGELGALMVLNGLRGGRSGDVRLGLRDGEGVWRRLHLAWSVIGGVLNVAFGESGEHDLLLRRDLRTSGFKCEMWRLLLGLGLLMGLVDGFQRGGDKGVVSNRL